MYFNLKYVIKLVRRLYINTVLIYKCFQNIVKDVQNACNIFSTNNFAMKKKKVKARLKEQTNQVPY